jgi:Transport and Golgi organisation 2
MCTVLCRWHPDESFAVQMLALRDELASRSFDLPGAWWPDQPGVIGGRDRTAGGSWCVSDVDDGVTAVVLNRPERRTAEVGAPSRGVVPLLAARHRNRWPEVLDVSGMASFNLVLAAPGALCWWSFDGQRLQQEELPTGTHMFTPSGLTSADTDHRLAAGGARLGADPAAPTNHVWADWLSVLAETTPSEDPSELIVRRPIGDDSYETVFGQFIAAQPGLLRLDYLTSPADGTERPWTTTVWTSADVARARRSG